MCVYVCVCVCVCVCEDNLALFEFSAYEINKVIVVNKKRKIAK